MNVQQQQAVDTFLPCMPDVARWERGLHELNQVWHLIEASAKMNCPREARLLLPSIVATRTGFAQLQRDLIANLVQEKVQQVLVELATRAQYMIDIVVRNLFERTADVGFLSTDSALCRFAAGLDAGAEAVRARLADYRAKYTVYDAILMLDLEGRVLVHTDTSGAMPAGDALLAAAALDQPGYVETFRASALRPGKPRALLYAQRMCHPDSGEAVGVLCLSFHFEQEMAAIFGTYRDPGQRANMLLLDGAGAVIASADPLWMPAGAAVPTNLAGDGAGQARLHIWCGRAYLVRTFASSGYQGYPGPDGWKGQVMAPLDLAFRADQANLSEGLDPALLQGLLSHAHSFNPALHGLMAAVRETSRTIKHIVWNGKVATAGALDESAGHSAGHSDVHSNVHSSAHSDARAGQDSGKLNSVLDQITETGQRGDDLFSRSIQELYQTVLSSSMHAAASTAQLLVDMLDRNLYERANDCRWWALTPQLRAGLADPADPAKLLGMREVLASIHRLYPVYSRLLAYNPAGKVIAASGAGEGSGEGSIDSATVSPGAAAHVCALADAQDHYAEPFGPSALYGGESTFIYHAAVRHPQQPSTVVGGIAVVFDARPELLNMLHSGVAARANMHACYVRPDGRILASTDPACPPGSVLALGADLPDGAAGARVVVHEGQYKIAAKTRASGYREFRRGAAREEEVIGVVLVAFGAVRDTAGSTAGSNAGAGADREHGNGADGAGEGGSAGKAGRQGGNAAGRDLAIFDVGGALMALPAARVLEALPFSRVRTRAGGGACVGMLNPQERGQPFVWVFDLNWLLNGRASAWNQESQVILLRHEGGAIGLLVDGLHAVRRFAEADIGPHPLAGDPQTLCSRIVKAEGAPLIPEIDADRLIARLRSSPSA